MDITSYLIGKKSSGGGGGGSGLDWTALGYSEIPPTEQEIYNHALEIKNNWTTGNKLNEDDKLNYVPLIDCSNVTDGTLFFYNNPTLRYVPALNMTSVKDCRFMFNECPLLTHTDFKNFDTTNVTRMDSMFASCKSLEELDLSSFYTPNLTRVGSMFYLCSKLKKIDMRNFSLTQITNSSYYSNMFNGVPDDCLIIVKDNTEKSWITTKFANLTNVKTVDEYNAM